MTFEEEFPGLVNYYNKFNLDVSTEYMGKGKVHFHMNIYPEAIIQKHCLDKDRVIEVIDDFEKHHFEEESDHPSMPIHKSDFINLKKKLGLK